MNIAQAGKILLDNVKFMALTPCMVDDATHIANASAQCGVSGVTPTVYVSNLTIPISHRLAHVLCPDGVRVSYGIDSSGFVH